MQKSGLNSEQLTADTVIERKDITSLSIANTGATDMIVTLNSVAQVVPAYDEVNKYAPVFNIDADGTCFDLKLTVEFLTGTGKAILRYRQLLTKQC